MHASENFSRPDPAKAVTRRDDETHNDLEARLSILRTAYDQALAAGLLAKSTQQETPEGVPVLTIQILNATKCPECLGWWIGTKCPICQ